jgi:hypothetical protein
MPQPNAIGIERIALAVLGDHEYIYWDMLFGATSHRICSRME